VKATSRILAKDMPERKEVILRHETENLFWIVADGVNFGYAIFGRLETSVFLNGLYLKSGDVEQWIDCSLPFTMSYVDAIQHIKKKICYYGVRHEG
jgi:hypothetical protein